MRSPTMICAALLLSGCFRSEAVTEAPPEKAGPDFCLVEEPRRFTQAEVDWRAANAPANFRRDLKTNATGRDECGWKPQEK